MSPPQVSFTNKVKPKLISVKKKTKYRDATQKSLKYVLTEISFSGFILRSIYIIFCQYTPNLLLLINS